ncbi:MAG TPA: S9 family peptidase [Vicinamibacterales bacterium]|nr:S9 family peptidase [Vicinamibacterales bacterium]
MQRARLPGAILLAAFFLQPAIEGRQSASSAATPTIDQLISLKRAGSAAISPDAKWVAYTVRDANWDENTFHTEIWLADAKSGESRQLTNHAKKSSTSPAWSPDSTKLAFGTDRDDKRQIYLIDPRGGEARKLTSAEEGVGTFAWSPDGRTIAFTSTDAKTDADKEREKTFGEFDVIGEGYRMSHLWLLDVASQKARRLTSGAFTVGQFSWSPDGTQIAFDHRVNSANANGGTADISVVKVSDGAIRHLVTQDGPDAAPVWSPDGSKIAFETSMAKPFYFYTNHVIAVIPSAGGPIDNLSTAFDEDPSIVRWTAAGIFFSASQRTSSFLFSIDPATRAVKKYAPSESWMGGGFSLTPDAQWMACQASDPSMLAEVFVAPVATALKPRKLTDMSAQIATWPKSALEVVSWKSEDGATIEGVLHKPTGFQAGKKYPLLVVIHGGPTGISRPSAFSSTSIYPIDIWTSKGALVLEPNYRGSAGYGEAFRSLNVRNLGVGDAWDVLSGVDALIKQGLADPDRVATMGWSQGGYISAYLTTHDSARFKAVSVGAGISDWMTYYANTDITPFTRQYLKGTPWEDPEIYAKTSPITYIKNARAPTLIQHGATDQRVPPPNAFELYRGLQDLGVPSKLIVYKGFEGVGHGPSKPKSSRAVMQHNLEWFDKYIWGVTATTSTGSR